VNAVPWNYEEVRNTQASERCLFKNRNGKEDKSLSYTSTVHLRLSLAVALALSLLAPATALAGKHKQADSNHNTTASRPLEQFAPAARNVVQREPIPYSTLRKPTSQLRSGTSRTVRSGANGEKEVIYQVTYRPDGVELRREVVSTHVIKKPVDEVMEIGRAMTLPSRGYFSGRRVVLMVATTYDPYNCGGNGSGRTATGLRAHYGVVAVDPRFIPLGTRLYIEGYGYAVAADTGGAIKGNRIDLCIDSRHDAPHIGDWRHVRVHILD
jgi:3D (Asp-Asp-Asp) domain-containing protein